MPGPLFAPGSARTACIALSVCGVLFAGVGAALHVRSYLLGEAVAEGGSRSDGVCLGAARRMGGDLLLGSSETGAVFELDLPAPPHLAIVHSEVA